MITFAIVGHDEAETLAEAVRQAQQAAGPGDRVVFVDSASTDGSAEVAAAQGAEVWPAPLGKGAAMRTAIERDDRDWMVFLDADVYATERNVAVVLAEAVRAASGAAMVVGDFSDPNPGGVLSNTWGIYEPVVAALFPELVDRFGGKPLSGFRALRAGTVADTAAIPNDFGVEAHLNVVAGLGAAPLEVVALGWYEGRFLYKPYMGLEIARGLLDAAEARGRLAPARRPEWDAWVLAVADVVATYHGDPADREAYRARLGTARARPLPPAT